jgi:hypothetical protein
LSPREKSSARAKRKLEGREKVANGTADQTTALLRTNHLVSVGFRELLVRTPGRRTVRKNRGRTEDTPQQGSIRKIIRTGKEKGRMAQSHPGCKGCK